MHNDDVCSVVAVLYFPGEFFNFAYDIYCIEVYIPGSISSAYFLNIDETVCSQSKFGAVTNSLSESKGVSSSLSCPTNYPEPNMLNLHSCCCTSV